MKNFILLISMFLVFTACETKKETLTLETVEPVLLAKERLANDQWSAGHPSGFAVNFANDITWFDDIVAQSRIEGRENMQNYFQSLEGKIPAHSYKLVDPKVQLYGETAILTYQYYSTMPNGEPGPPWKATSVYHLNNDEWQVVHAHWSLVNK
jgi:hypothetical protein